MTSPDTLPIGAESLPLEPPVLINTEEIKAPSEALGAVGSHASADVRRTIVGFEQTLHDLANDGEVSMQDVTVAADDIVGRFALRKLRAVGATTGLAFLNKVDESPEEKIEREKRGMSAYGELIDICVYLDNRFPIADEDETVAETNDGKYWIERYLNKFGTHPDAETTDHTSGVLRVVRHGENDTDVVSPRSADTAIKGILRKLLSRQRG